MRNTVIIFTALAANAFCAVIACGQTLNVKVSDTLLELNQKWAAAYQVSHPSPVIQVTSERTAETFAALAAKQVDLVIVSRSIRYKEAQACEAILGKRPPELKLAVSGLAVYVNSNNPVMQLTYDELYKIFHGESTNWKEFDNGQDLAISVYVQSTNSARGELFNEEVMDGREFSASAHTLVGQELLKAVAADPQAIGFGPLATMGGLKPLGIKRAFSSTPVLPTEDNLSKQIYPITRCLFSYCNPTAKAGDLKPYLDWIRSDEGQAVARAAGFYPLPAGSRSRQ